MFLEPCCQVSVSILSHTRFNLVSCSQTKSRELGSCDPSGRTYAKRLKNSFKAILETGIRLEDKVLGGRRYQTRVVVLGGTVFDP